MENALFNFQKQYWNIKPLATHKKLDAGSAIFFSAPRTAVCAIGLYIINPTGLKDVNKPSSLKLAPSKTLSFSMKCLVGKEIDSRILKFNHEYLFKKSSTFSRGYCVFKRILTKSRLDGLFSGLTNLEICFFLVRQNKYYRLAKKRKVDITAQLRRSS